MGEDGPYILLQGPGGKQRRDSSWSVEDAGLDRNEDSGYGIGDIEKAFG